MKRNKVYNEDCLAGMKRIPDKSIDMILCDLPYGTTACAWDEIIPFEPLWEQYERIIKDDGAIVLTGQQPFTSALVMSNPEWFKYEWIYEKRVGSNFASAKYMPLKEHENVLVFGKGKTKYFPIMQERSESGKQRIQAGYKTNSKTNNETMGNIKRNNTEQEYNPNLRNPGTVQEFNNRAVGARGLHPTQKPLELFEYLIETYTEKGDIVLDNCMGSGTTAIACLNTSRDYLGFELDPKYHHIIQARIDLYHQGNKYANKKDVKNYIEKSGHIQNVLF